MRKKLLESFDKIYILDLHGNAKKKEVCPDGSPDQNVFDIMQGVSINIFVKTGNKKKNELGEVYHYDLQGKRDFKYKFLEESLINLKWQKLIFEEPYYFFVPKNFDLDLEYKKGFKVDDLFRLNSNGIETKCDSLSIHFNKQKLQEVITDFKNEDVQTLKNKYKSKEDSSGWNFENAKKSIVSDIFFNQKIQYRPFDNRETIITKNSGGFIGRSRFDVMKHFLSPNIGLIIPRQTTQDYRHSFITNKIIDGNITASAKLFGTGCVFPLYLYPDTYTQQTLDGNNSRTPNLNPVIIKQIADGLGLTFTNEKETESDVCFANSDEARPEFKQSFAPIDLLDYIYAVLHSPSYREKYKEFLKIDFPRVPAPPEKDTFWKLVKLGSELRQIHLLESPIIEKYITQYPEDGDNIVAKPKYKEFYMVVDENIITHNDPPYPMGNVFINETQYFANVPEVAWNFYIGGYQPAQKWLKDRKDRELSYEDILHYQKIIVALFETDRIMKEIDKIEI
jgi:predicted helicase